MEFMSGLWWWGLGLAGISGDRHRLGLDGAWAHEDGGRVVSRSFFGIPCLIAAGFDVTFGAFACGSGCMRVQCWVTWKKLSQSMHVY